jgi:hypothetical protein
MHRDSSPHGTQSRSHSWHCHETTSASVHSSAPPAASDDAPSVDGPGAVGLRHWCAAAITGVSALCLSGWSSNQELRNLDAAITTVYRIHQSVISNQKVGMAAAAMPCKRCAACMLHATSMEIPRLQS